MFHVPGVICYFKWRTGIRQFPSKPKIHSPANVKWICVNVGGPPNGVVPCGFPSNQGAKGRLKNTHAMGMGVQFLRKGYVRQLEFEGLSQYTQLENGVLPKGRFNRFGVGSLRPEAPSWKQTEWIYSNKRGVLSLGLPGPQGYRASKRIRGRILSQVGVCSATLEK